jgi:hypothetical protein
MEITIVAGSDELQQVIATWRYPEASDFYDGDAEPVLNPSGSSPPRGERRS